MYEDLQFSQKISLQSPESILSYIELLAEIAIQSPVKLKPLIFEIIDRCGYFLSYYFREKKNDNYVKTFTFDFFFFQLKINFSINYHIF